MRTLNRVTGAEVHRYPVNTAAIEAGTTASMKGALSRPKVRAMPIPHTPPRQSGSAARANTPRAYVPTLSASPIRQGYSSAHQGYQAAAEQARSIRLSSESYEFVTIQYSVEIQKGKKASSILHNLPIAGIPLVDARIGGPDLKALVLDKLKGSWACFTYNFPLDPTHFTLRSAKTRVDLVQNFPLVNAIYDECVTTKGRAKRKFNPQAMPKVVLFFDPMMLDVLDDHIHEQSSKVDKSTIASNLAIQATRSAHVVQPLGPPSTPVQGVKRTADILSPDPNEPPQKSLEIISKVSNMKFATISYKPTAADSLLGFGQFKTCLRGVVSASFPLWSGSSADGSGQLVALKRPFQVNPANPNVRSRLAHPELKLRKIVMETTSMRWATSLLEPVYQFVGNHSKQAGSDAPQVPLMRFVGTGIAKCVKTSATSLGSFDGAFLVEELIPSSLKFCRLLGNSSATPAVFPPGDVRRTVADFCAFAQHIQWDLTQGTAYCADWQGGVDLSTGETLLTDPQILTHPSLGDIFADGNNSDTFVAFTAQHDCKKNVFCRFFELSPVISYS
ncbi:hypothetical protein RhiJN_11603 [Ceratobasidium sp. AG-Ba]|nr:hypothetical protein RhiJN_11603 [Ceratobasidium sp. AG-Ba]